MGRNPFCEAIRVKTDDRGRALPRLNNGVDGGSSSRSISSRIEAFKTKRDT